MTNCVIYARVSSKEQQVEGYSIPAQLALFKTYCQQKGLKVVKEYAESESARNSGRKLFNDMLAYVKENKIPVIVFEKVDRMTRNFKDLVSIYDLIENMGISVHLIKNSLVLDKNSRSQDKFQLDIHVVLARNYINNLSEEVKKGTRQKLLQGGWTHHAPFGYKNIRENGQARVVIDPDEAKIVIEMFQLASEGNSHAAIQGIIAPRRKISIQTVNKTLKNRFYVGILDSGGEIYQGKHELFLNQELFDIVQAKIRKKAPVFTALDRSFKFSGLISCSCGNKLYGEVKKGKYTTYGCGARKNGKKCTNAGIKYISEKKIFEQLNVLVQKINLTELDFERIQGMCGTMYHDIEVDAARSRQSKYKEIEKVTDKLSRLLDHYDEKVITLEEYQEHKAKLLNQRIQIRAELDALIDVPEKMREDYSNLFKMLIGIDKYWHLLEKADDFRNIFQSLMTLLTLEGETLTVSWTPLGNWLVTERSYQLWWERRESLASLKEHFLDWRRSLLAA